MVTTPPLFTLNKLEKNKIGKGYALTENEEYICPSDGYFLISNDSASNNVSCGYINDIEFIKISNPTDSRLTSYQNMSIFVKEGMRIKFTGTVGNFYPII